MTIGWTGSFDKLEEYLKKIQRTQAPDKNEGLIYPLTSSDGSEIRGAPDGWTVPLNRDLEVSL